MVLHVTYCAANKRPDPGPLPALERYVSARIRAIQALATGTGDGFRILSGRYGLLAATDPIPHYDHLLRADEVTDLAERVAGQLRDLEPGGVVLHARPCSEDPQAVPYRETMARACARAGRAFEVRDYR